MTVQSPLNFKRKAREALADPHLQKAMTKAEAHFADGRARARDALPEFDDLRDEGIEIKNHTLAHIDYYLEKFEEQVVAHGGHVHWCSTPKDARQAILKICQDHGATTVTKGKSMVTEEIHLNPFLEENGITPIETDLGEYIIQLAQEPPSHIIGPALHKTKEQVSDLFHEHHRQYGLTDRQTGGEALVAEAREVLRKRFLEADIGITGANFLVAETGSTIIVTNEGNGDLTQNLPKTHLVVSSIEKILPTLEDVSTIMRVLARSATGQEMSVYTTLSSGPKRPGDVDGPENYHVVIVDNGRSRLLGTDFQDVLRCIKCGACMNHCPVYGNVGGHAYGAVYMGPIGSVLTPNLIGLEEGLVLPNASTFCGRCQEVCPMRIPLPGLMRKWREKGFEASASPAVERYGIRLWAFAARRRWLYHLGLSVVLPLLALLGRRKGRLGRLPLAGGWTNSRDLPAPAARSFMSQYKLRRRS